MSRDTVYNEALEERMSADLTGITWDEELEGSNEAYLITPAVLFDVERDMYVVVYGVYNRATSIRETETRQLNAAIEFVNIMTTAQAQRSGLPGLEDDDQTEAK